MALRGNSNDMPWPTPFRKTEASQAGLPHQGALGIAGMFGVVKVRERLGGNDYRDPGWLKSRIGVSASADKFPFKLPRHADRSTHGSSDALPCAPVALPWVSIKRTLPRNCLFHRPLVASLHGLKFVPGNWH